MKNLSSATPHTTSTDRDGIMEKKGVRERGEGGVGIQYGSDMDK